MVSQALLGAKCIIGFAGSFHCKLAQQPAGSLVDHLKATEFAVPTFSAPIDQVDCVIFQVMIDVWGSSDEVSPGFLPSLQQFSHPATNLFHIATRSAIPGQENEISAINPESAANVP